MWVSFRAFGFSGTTKTIYKVRDIHLFLITLHTYFIIWHCHNVLVCLSCDIDRSIIIKNISRKKKSDEFASSLAWYWFIKHVCVCIALFIWFVMIFLHFITNNVYLDVSKTTLLNNNSMILLSCKPSPLNETHFIYVLHCIYELLLILFFNT